MVYEAREFDLVVILVLDLDLRRKSSRDGEDEVKVGAEYDVVAAAVIAAVVAVAVEGQNRGVWPGRRSVAITIGRVRAQGTGSSEALLAHSEFGLLA